MSVIHLSGNRALFHCPGCECAHGPVVKREHESGPQWTWNGSLDKPTFSPSILVRGSAPLTEDQLSRIMAGEKGIRPLPTVCHSFVRDGRIEFLGDCTHKLAGQTVDLPDWERT